MADPNAARRLEPQQPSPIRAARDAAGLSQVQLAAKAGVALSTLQIAERGLVSRPVAERLAGALGVNPDALTTTRS